MDKRRQPYPQKARDRMCATKIIDKLMACVEGKIAMDAQQIAAARILLNKVLPDLKAIEFTGEIAAEREVDPQTLEEVVASVTERLAAAY